MIFSIFFYIMTSQSFFIELNSAIFGYEDGDKFCLELVMGLKMINITGYPGKIYFCGGRTIKNMTA